MLQLFCLIVLQCNTIVLQGASDAMQMDHYKLTIIIIIIMMVIIIIIITLILITIIKIIVMMVIVTITRSLGAAIVTEAAAMKPATREAV